MKVIKSLGEWTYPLEVFFKKIPPEYPSVEQRLLHKHRSMPTAGSRQTIQTMSALV
jgi:hypothetical protein